MANGQIIEQSNARWLLRVYEGSDPATGKRLYRSETVHGPRAAAEQALERMCATRIRRPQPDSSLDLYLDWWLTVAVDRKLRAKSAADYRSLLARYVRPVVGKRKLSRLTALDLQELYNGRGDLAPRTIRYTHSVLRSALEQARKWKLISANPARDVVLPRHKPVEMRCLDRSEAARLADACRNQIDRVFFLVALGTGLRPSEALALRWQDLDVSRRSLQVTRTIERVKGKWIFEDTKRPRSRRTVMLPETTLHALVNLRAAQGDLPKFRSGLVFTTESGTPIHERNLVQRVFKPLLREAELPDIRLYDLRHTYATLALSAGVPARVVSGQLGHASVGFTLEVYAHVLAEDRDSAAEPLDRILAASPSRKEPQRASGIGLQRQVAMSE